MNRCENCKDYSCMDRRTAGDCLKEQRTQYTTNTDGTGIQVNDAIPPSMIDFRNNTAKEVLLQLISGGWSEFDEKRYARISVDFADELVKEIVKRM